MSYPLTTLMPRACIRPALQEVAGEISRLFLISSEGLAAYIWSKTDAPSLSLEEIGAARYATTNTSFSFENCLVAVRSHRIAGLVHAFPMKADGYADLNRNRQARAHRAGAATAPATGEP